MKSFEILQSFAKGKASDNTKHGQRNAVIYTRVSTKEQADTNQSLETQKKYCLQYALKNDLNVLGFFGGTYESAKEVSRPGNNGSPSHNHQFHHIFAGVSHFCRKPTSSPFIFTKQMKDK